MMADPIERAEIRTAIAQSAVVGSISRKLGDELIAASREVVLAWYQRSNGEVRLRTAVTKLEELVGRPR